MLELQNVSYSVTENDTSDGSGASKEIIKNISLKIEDAFTAITGPNGGGKSTLAKLIAGIITEKGILRPDYNKSIAEAFKK
jgi:Fe-S cluster assembly ATP-binding protein